MKKVLGLLLLVVVSFALIGCDTDESYAAQGISDEFILVGNTAPYEGLYAAVGIPFNLAMQVVFDEYNATHDGPDIKFVHEDDNFDGQTGLTKTKKLVEETKVFALVGHFGTPTVNATIDYLVESGIPMVYGVTGVNSLYFGENAQVGKNILTIQPIYRTEGRMLVARTFHESLFGPNLNEKLAEDKIVVVLYSDDDAGQSIRAGIVEQVTAEGLTNRVVYIPFNDITASSAVSDALALNPGAIILSSNQVATSAAIAMRQQNSTVPVVTSYVNAATVFTPAQVDGAPLPYPVYANAWVDIANAAAPAPTPEQIGGDGTLLGIDPSILPFLTGFTAEYWEGFVKDMNDSELTEGTWTTKQLWANAYAMAGYVAAKSFVAILERVEDFKTLTWESFIELAESAPIDLPLAGVIDWSNGKRVGLDTLSLNILAYPATGTTFAKIREVESLAVVLAK